MCAAFGFAPADYCRTHSLSDLMFDSQVAQEHMEHSVKERADSLESHLTKVRGGATYDQYALEVLRWHAVMS